MHKTPLALAGILMLTLAGCANTQPSTADTMRQHAAQDSSRAALQKDLAKQWDRGNELQVSGNKRIQAAERDVRQAERQLRDAQRALKQAKSDVTKGQRLQAQAEKRFAEQFPQSSL